MAKQNATTMSMQVLTWDHGSLESVDKRCLAYQGGSLEPDNPDI